MNKPTYIICDEKYNLVACGTYEDIDETFGLAISNGDTEFELSVLRDFVKTQKLFPDSKLKLFVETA